MSQPARILLFLVLGLGLGLVAANTGGAWVGTAVAVAEPVGGAWLDALRMTIVPLVVSLLVVGIVASAEAARAGRLAARSVLWMLGLIWLSAAAGALLLPLILEVFPLPTASAEALRAALGATEEKVGEVPPVADFLRSIVPTNPVAAAANDQILPLILFTSVFAFAITRLPDDQRRLLGRAFAAVQDAMLIVIGWVLALAPIGVFALAFAVMAKAGGAALGALAHYVLSVSAVGIAIGLLGYVIAVAAGRVPLGAFARAVAPAQALAVSTQSSLACLPVMLRGAERLGVSERAAGVTLPLAVALFRATGPAMNVAVALYVAHWYGVELGPAQIAAGVAAAAITTLGAVSLPGQVSFFTSIAPISLALGVPVEPLALLIAVETIPDIFRTLGNVTMDVAVSTAATRGERAAGAEAVAGAESV